jgi:citrate lyase beta subunit
VELSTRRPTGSSSFLSAMSFRFLFITNNPEIALFASARGVDLVFVDLEVHGKQERQGHLDTVMSRHSVADVARLRRCVPPGALLVRVNPVHAGTLDEVSAVVEGGADIVMLPMFRGPREVERFVEAVGGRARTSLLIETMGAMESLQECLSVPGVDEAHIGLNDLHLDLGKRFMFQPLAEGRVDRMAETLRERGIPFGIGGVARAGEGLLPAELLLGEHARLGSTAAILSRTFHRKATTVAEIEAGMDFGMEVAKLRAAYEGHLRASRESLRELHHEVQRRVASIVSGLGGGKVGGPAGG